MISTIETRKLVTVELTRSEVHNILKGAEMHGKVQLRHKDDESPIDVLVYCSNPEEYADGVEEQQG